MLGSSCLYCIMSIDNDNNDINLADQGDVALEVVNAEDPYYCRKRLGEAGQT